MPADDCDDPVTMANDIEEAISAGIEIVVLNQIVGPDLTTSDPQVDGIAASVLASPYRSGTRHGELTVRACEGNDNCEVVFIYGIKDGFPADDMNSIAVDKNGLIWVFTSKGLCSFDGVNVKVYDEKHGIYYLNTGNSWPEILVHPNGSIYICQYGGGLTIFKNGKSKKHL